MENVGNVFYKTGDAMGHRSEDASVLCSPDTYREFGKPYTEALVAPYDTAFLKQAKTALVCNAGSVAEAEAIVSFVRKELPIL